MDPDEIELLSELYPELDIGEIRTLLGISGRQRLSSLKTEKVEEVGIIIISSDSSSDSGDFSSEIRYLVCVDQPLAHSHGVFFQRK